MAWFTSPSARLAAVLCGFALAALSARACAGQTSPGAPVRDPFVSSAAPAIVGRAASSGGGGALPNLVLPPNAAAGTPPFESARPAQSGRVVRAIVLGTRSRALITSGGESTIVGVGDRLGDAIVTDISAAGLRLSNGTTLVLDGSGT